MDTIAKRIKAARQHAGLTQPQLSQACGWGTSNGRISNYESGLREPKSGDIAAIAACTMVSRGWIATGEGSMLPTLHDLDSSISQVAKEPRLRPLISSVPAGNCQEVIDNLQPGDAEAWLYGSPKSGKRSFMLRVDGQSQMPKYQDGMIIEVDPDVVAEHGDDVVARLSNGKATFKQLQITPEGRYLVARNPDWPERIIRVPDDTEICGVVIWAMFDPRSWR